MTDIDQPTAKIAAAHKRWQRARDVIEGADAVKARGTTYLPKLTDQQADEFEDYKQAVPFFPGAGVTHEGLIGMINRKPATMTAPAALEPILETITATGMTVDDLAEEVLSEILITNFVGLLVDHPASTAGLNAANAIAKGFRPFVAVYRAESILEVTPAVIENKLKVVRVRLKDDEDTVRELALVDGKYQVIIHRRVGGEWLADAPVVPLKRGQPLDAIPFVLATTKARKFEPQKAPLDDVVITNLDHYNVQAQHSLTRLMTCIPMIKVKGVADPSMDPDSKHKPIRAVPGTVIYLPVVEGVDADAEWMKNDAPAIGDIRQTALDLKEDMSQEGLRIIASEKNASEAAETHAIRRASENSRTASLARIVSRKIEEALIIVADWVGVTGELSYALSTDFLPTPMSSQDVAALQGLVAAGLMSKQTMFELLQQGEMIPDGLTYEEERSRIEEDQADMPTSQAGLSTFPQEPVEDQEAEEPTDR
ncbi:DUF4055 domain-containing protein [Sphingobium sp. BHU LFT2]|uniref:DUF4055 domain-containing protein n=1 Tax=Sphingobium sp. BHU LFT2 TaxID=2807634 RepID=UPI001BED1EFD|nr:DUF4055 domain-containing protein [Sphingobium sp. BHU LFT2]MBT2244566.1 DUF4055 domain-containing protein [Sphingobium sp. BHU LFT2]